MNLTTTMRVIGRHKALLVIGILLAVLAAFATAFRVETGTLAPRTIAEYQAPTQLLVSDPTSVFSTKTAPQTLVEGQTPAASRDLSSATVVYAYLVSSGTIRDLVEAEIGELSDNESISASQRTTQPSSTTNTGTYRLPILEIVGQAASKERAEDISRTAAAVFQQFASEQQDAAGVDADARVQLQVIREGDAAPVDGTNPALPIVAVGVGVLLAFLALIFAVDNARATRQPTTVLAPAKPPAPQPGGMTRPVLPNGAPRPATPPPPAFGTRIRDLPPATAQPEPANRR
jgi:capsular polysaccharide biosynthesis protein